MVRFGLDGTEYEIGLNTEHVQQLRAPWPHVRAARFGGENMKDVAGYDTKRLFIGSHNAFGIISTAIFKISARA